MDQIRNPIVPLRSAGFPPRSLIDLALHAPFGRGREGKAQVERDRLLQRDTPKHDLPPPATVQLGRGFVPEALEGVLAYLNMRFTEDPKQNPVQIPKSRANCWQASWKKFLIDMMYLRGYVSLYPNFPSQASLSTNHMEPGAHISAKDNVVRHDKSDFEVPSLDRDFGAFLPNGKLPSLNLFNQPLSLKGLKSAGAKLGQDVLECSPMEIVAVNHDTGLPLHCARY